MKNEELIMNNKKYKRVGAGLVPNQTQNAITLIALIITIIILLILAGVTINILIGDNGLFNTAKEAKDKTKIAEAKDILDIEIAKALAEKLGELHLNELAEYLKQDSRSKIYYRSKR